MIYINKHNPNPNLNHNHELWDPAGMNMSFHAHFFRRAISQHPARTCTMRIVLKERRVSETVRVRVIRCQHSTNSVRAHKQSDNNLQIHTETSE